MIDIPEESNAVHMPVLPTEVLTYLDPQPGQIIVDATVGAGGHARLIASGLGGSGQLIGLDQDRTMLEKARPTITACPTTLIHRNFDRLRAALDEINVPLVDGVLADIGFASDQVEDPRRGLSFRLDGPLDMRLDPESGPTAADLLARLDERSLADLFWEYGEERFSRRIAKRLVETRRQTPVRTTGQLADIIRAAVPGGRRPGQRIDPATRVFQALRIAVNDELGSLERLLEQLPSCLKPGGRAVIISFHSLEDRRVKQSFRDKVVWEVLTKKPVTATDEEMRNNPRSRSAKLRAAKKT